MKLPNPAAAEVRARRVAMPDLTTDSAPAGRNPGSPPDRVLEFEPDYVDRFAVDAGPHELEPRHLARRALAGAAAANDAFGRLVWGALLGFELDRGAPGTMLGWRVSSETATELVLDTDGPRMAGRMVFARSGDELVWTTMLRFHGAAGRRIWALAGNAHRFIAPRALASARPSR